MSAAIELEITELLEQAGAVPPRHGRGKWTCPECKCPALGVNKDRGLYHCFHAGCAFHGGIGTLRKRLGLRREWLPRAEHLRLRREREQANKAAEQLYATIKARRLELLDQIHSLNRIEQGAHRSGADRPETWLALAMVHAERPSMLVELAILENCRVPELVRFLTADTQTRQAAVDRVLGWGGLQDASGKFLELTY